MSDLISRQAAIDALDDEITITGKANAYVVKDYVNRVKRKLEELPSAQPEVLACGSGKLDVPDGWHWIPCSERLPEYGIEVVTVNKDGEYEINHIIDEEDGEWFWEKAIAWMPLPEPYKERREE